MSYQSLAKLFYMDSSPNRHEANRELADKRRQAESTFSLGIETPHGELFCAVPRELSVLNEKVLRYERKISASVRDLPTIAHASLIRSLVVDEVVSTNELEGVHGTRRQINDILEAQPPQPPSRNSSRFGELARLYLNLTNPGVDIPRTPEEVRDIYDTVMWGEDLGKDIPDGKIFRAGRVEILGQGGKVLHEGVYPESEIISHIEKMLSIASSDDIPATFSAILSHYLFEYIHPFYDGNGRTGRYLLALYLSSPLSLLTTLSLSKAIAANKATYYKSFKDAENPLNHGELTGFVINFLEMLRIAQVEIDLDITNKREQLGDAFNRIETLKATGEYGSREAEIMLMLAQVKLFGAFDDATQKEITEFLNLSPNQARKYTMKLEESGIITKVSNRPLRYALSESMSQRLCLD